MQAYAYFLQGLIMVAWVFLAVIFSGALYVGMIELYDAIKQGRMRWSHIRAVFFMTAEYVVYKVTREKNAGRHAVEIKKEDAVASFWQELKTEFEARPYSLSRANRSHKLA